MKKQGRHHSLEGDEKRSGLVMSGAFGQVAFVSIWSVRVERLGSVGMKLVQVPVEKGFY